MSVTKGIEAINIMRRMAGESARRNGLDIRSCDVRSRMDDAEWILRGRSIKRRAVSIDKTRGTIENRRSLRFELAVASRQRGVVYDLPNGLAPCWLLISVPHKTANKGPYCRNEERDWYKH